MEKRLKIYFNDGNELEFAYEIGVDPSGMGEYLTKLLNQSNIIIEAEGHIYLIPTSSIKYLDVSPAPEILGNQVIKGARLIR